MRSTAPCRVAIVGAGYTAREHLRALRDVEGVVPSGLYSRSRGRAEALAREFAVKHVCNSLAELYERSGAALVVVAVPELAMNAVAQASFDFPWTVLLEKPPGHDLEDALEIQHAAEARQRRVLVALNRRFLSATLQAKSELNHSAGPRFIQVQDQQDQSAARRAGQPREVVENWMYANSIHTVDYLRGFGRGPITAVDRILPWDAGHPGSVVCRVSFDSGDVGFYEGIWHAPGPWAVTVTVAGKRCEMRPLENLTVQEQGQPPHPVCPDAWDSNFKPGFRRQAEAAVRAAMGDTSDAVSLADAIETMRLIARIFSPNQPPQ